MAQNDMEVLIYKILRYLYECLKTGHQADLADVSPNCKLFQIPCEYWFVIMKEIHDGGYVDGLIIVDTKTFHEVKQIDGKLRITEKGREYLCENSVMKKVAEALKGTSFFSLLGSIVGFIC